MTNANDTNHESVRRTVNETVVNRKSTTSETLQSATTPDVDFKPQIRWPDLAAQVFLHTGAIYAIIFLFYKIKFLTLLWCK